MKNLICAVSSVVILIFVASCSNDGLGRRRPGGENITSNLVENPNWTITYNGRIANIADDGTIVEDVINVKSSDSKQYFLDLVSKEKLANEFGNSIDKFVNHSLTKLKENENYRTLLSIGNSRVPYLRLDNGGASWLAITYGVDANGKLTGEYAYLDFSTVEVQMQNTSNWKIEYTSRDPKTEQDHIIVTPSNASTYYIDVVYNGYVNDAFNGDVYKFFNEMLDNLSKQLNKDDKDFSRLIFKGKTTQLFDRLRAGKWTAYAYGVDKNGFLTGSYSTYDFQIAEEVPTYDFKKWLGKWEISPDNDVKDQNGNVIDKNQVSYSLEISKAEANVAYIVSGWETKDVDIVEYTSKMRFEAKFDKATGNLVFTYFDMGSWKGSDNNNYATILGGLYLENNNEFVFLDNAEFAIAKIAPDNRSAKAVGKRFIKNNNTLNFCGMCYLDILLDANKKFVPNKTNSIRSYSKYIPYFPMTMTYTGPISTGKAAAGGNWSPKAMSACTLNNRKPAIRVSSINENISAEVKSSYDNLSNYRIVQDKPIVRRSLTCTETPKTAIRPTNR